MPDQLISLREALAARLSQLTETELDSLEEVVLNELELRVGTKITGILTAEQVKEFEKLIEASDDDGASAFLDRSVPKHREVVHETMKELVDETVRRITEADQAGTL